MQFYYQEGSHLIVYQPNKSETSKKQLLGLFQSKVLNISDSLLTVGQFKLDLANNSQFKINIQFSLENGQQSLRQEKNDNNKQLSPHTRIKRKYGTTLYGKTMSQHVSLSLKRMQLEPGKQYLFCCCGLSKNQPFCDQSHEGTKFKPIKFVPTNKTNILCLCKKSKSLPFCDNTHKKLMNIDF